MADDNQQHGQQRRQQAMEGRAAAHVDGEHRQQHHALILHHRHEEQGHLRLAKRQLASFDDSRAMTEARYVQRMRSIDEKRDRIADRLHQQHNSIGGRLQAMTRAGRARQQDQLERLNDRAALLQGRATQQFNDRTERHFHAQQAERIFHARHLKTFRAANADDRQQHSRQHEQTRHHKIADRVQAMQRVETREQKQELDLKREFQQAQANRTLRDDWQQAQGRGRWGNSRQG